MSDKTSIIVLGGGPAGSVCAQQLTCLGHGVTLIERGKRAGPRLGEICSPRTRHLLAREVGFTPPTSASHSLSAFFSAWGSEKIEGRSFLFWQTDNALVLDRRLFDECLINHAEDSGATVLRGGKPMRGYRDGSKWLLEVDYEGQKHTLMADFIVEATGRRARSILQPDLKRFFVDDLICLTLELPQETIINPIAMVESCEVGWWYTSPLPKTGQVVALFTDANLHRPSEIRLDWLKTLLDSTRHVRRVMNWFPKSGKLTVWSARTSARNLLWRHNWISIGDAAWSLDPLSGAGIERAISDGIEVAVPISKALNTGNLDYLKSYALSRANAFREALAVQRQYYGIETRWKDYTFWLRRL